MNQSLAEVLATLPKDERAELLADLPPEALASLQYEWRLWARPKQLAPLGDWLVWMILAGRGNGKTRGGTEWVRGMVEGPTPLQAAKGAPRDISIIGDNPTDVRRYIIEGPGGFERNTPKDQRPHYSTTKQELKWPNGCKALLFSAEDPEAIRGASSEKAWCDELAKWRYQDDAWKNLQFAMREGLRPQILVTTTPRPTRLIKDLAARSTTVVVHGTSYENRSNLAPAYYDEVIAPYEGTRWGRQEIGGEILDDVVGALWSRELLDEHRILKKKDVPDLARVVVGVDPAITADEETSAETGIVAAGTAEVEGGQRGYVLDDYSGIYKPSEWAKQAIAAYDRYEADAIVAEVNQGGDMVENTIHAVRANVKVIKVRATRGKVVRAEPVSALYEQGRVSHVGTLDKLEDQMLAFSPGMSTNDLKDRAEALVWAFTQLFPTLKKKASRKRKKRRRRITNAWAA